MLGRKYMMFICGHTHKRLGIMVLGAIGMGHRARSKSGACSRSAQNLLGTQRNLYTDVYADYVPIISSGSPRRDMGRQILVAYSFSDVAV